MLLALALVIELERIISRDWLGTAASHRVDRGRVQATGRAGRHGEITGVRHTRPEAHPDLANRRPPHANCLRSAEPSPTSNDVQTRTAVAGGCRYTEDMQNNFVKAAMMATWVVAIAGLGYMAGTTSLAAWTVLTVVSLVPPVLLMRFGSPPAPSMSETIRRALR